MPRGGVVLELARLHYLGYVRQPVGHVVRHPVFVVGEMEGQPHQRPAVDIAVGRVEAEVIAPVAHHAAMAGERCRREVILGHRLLPATAPARRVLGCRVIVDRPAIGGPQREKPPPMKPLPPWSKLSPLKSSTAMPSAPAPLKGRSEKGRVGAKR